MVSNGINANEDDRDFEKSWSIVGQNPGVTRHDRLLSLLISANNKDPDNQRVLHALHGKFHADAAGTADSSSLLSFQTTDSESQGHKDDVLPSRPKDGKTHAYLVASQNTTRGSDTTGNRLKTRWLRMGFPDFGTQLDKHAITYKVRENDHQNCDISSFDREGHFLEMLHAVTLKPEIHSAAQRLQEKKDAKNRVKLIVISSSDGFIKRRVLRGKACIKGILWNGKSVLAKWSAGGNLQRGSIWDSERPSGVEGTPGSASSGEIDETSVPEGSPMRTSLESKSSLRHVPLKNPSSENRLADPKKDFEATSHSTKFLDLLAVGPLHVTNGPLHSSASSFVLSSAEVRKNDKPITMESSNREMESSGYRTPVFAQYPMGYPPIFNPESDLPTPEKLEPLRVINGPLEVTETSDHISVKNVPDIPFSSERQSDFKDANPLGKQGKAPAKSMIASLRGASREAEKQQGVFAKPHLIPPSRGR